MEEELFNELIDSIHEGGEILRLTERVRELEAEVMRLVGEANYWKQGYSQQSQYNAEREEMFLLNISKLQAENERLRKAQEEIVGDRFDGFTSPREAAHHHVDIARRALHPETGGESSLQDELDAWEKASDNDVIDSAGRIRRNEGNAVETGGEE